MKKINKVKISGELVFPIIEGGKGIGVSNGITAGAFAAAEAVGTISGVFPPGLSDEGKYTHLPFSGKTRKDRSKEIIQHSINGSIREINTAYELSKGKGRIHLNVLWGIAGAEEILNEVLLNTQGKLHGVTCGAGMPYRLSEIASQYNVYYYPIISSSRAFKLLWTRAYHKHAHLLGGVVYEDPWKAGGHNGLSNKDNPLVAENPFLRVAELRKEMNECGLFEVPIIMAGGVWNIKPFEDWLDNPEIGPIAFQLGTRPLITKESPISKSWKDKLMSLKKGDVQLNKFSSTGFYSSAINNHFLQELKERAEKQIAYSLESRANLTLPFIYDKNKPAVYIDIKDFVLTEKWKRDGFDKIVETPDSTLLFLNKDKAKKIHDDQKNCNGCLAVCKFSSWANNPDTNYLSGKKADPRSFCIFKTLENIVCDEDIEDELIFSGHEAYNFSRDPLYNNHYVPSIKELVTEFMRGE